MSWTFFILSGGMKGKSLKAVHKIKITVSTHLFQRHYKDSNIRCVNVLSFLDENTMMLCIMGCF